MSKNIRICVAFTLALAFTNAHAQGGPGFKHPDGLTPQAAAELQEAGVDKYVGQFTPAVSAPVGDGWIKHTFDPAGGAGPICVAGTEYSVFTKARNPAKLLVMLQGGGACWQGFYNCNVLSEAQEPPAPPVGIWDEADKRNPVGDWSVVYMPYCDGSVFSGDNAVFDPAFGQAIGVEEAIVRFHFGLRNVTAGMDVAKAMFPNASRVLVAGSSAGGVGAAGFAPFLARMAYGDNKKLMVLNDAGPVAINLADIEGIMARANDWQFGQFYPSSCTACSAMGQSTEIIKWRLDNDSTIREAFYTTDGDFTNRFFLGLLPPTPRQVYRDLLVDEHGLIHDAHPDRYKRFIRSGDASHTAIQTPLLYDGEANGVPLYQWVDDFLVPRPSWVDLVEDFVPGP
jgi:hypothetical protein